MFVIAASIILLLSIMVSAGMMIPANEHAKEHAKASVVLPSHAVEVAPSFVIKT